MGFTGHFYKITEIQLSTFDTKVSNLNFFVNMYVQNIFYTSINTTACLDEKFSCYLNNILVPTLIKSIVEKTHKNNEQNSDIHTYFHSRKSPQFFSIIKFDLKFKYFGNFCFLKYLSSQLCYSFNQTRLFFR